MMKFGSIVILGIALFVLTPTSSTLRAQGFSLTLDLAHFADSVEKFYKDWRDTAHKDEVQRRKDSVAVLSAHMIRIAATKRTLADFLKDHPLAPSTCGGAGDQFACEDPNFKERERNSAIVRRQLEKLNREIAGLQDDLDDIDPTWAAKNPELQGTLTAVGLGKGLRWGSLGELDVVAFQKWLYKEADALEAAAREIKNKLPS
jgi:hypothetical protein